VIAAATGQSFMKFGTGDLMKNFTLRSMFILFTVTQNVLYVNSSMKGSHCCFAMATLDSDM
jgi:hypothetical protein